MIENIRKLAQTKNAMDAMRQDLIRCGFELEFHSVDGQEGSEDESSDFDINAPHIEVGSDSSVRGGEIRTVGALKPTEFMAAASALFDGHDFEIDTGCSFHIHLSVPGIKHHYGKNLQAEMLAYLLENQHRLPASVRQRLNSDAIRFCKFKVDADKFTAVHGHPQKTWEFRLFGNITNKHDAWKCLLLAIDTLRHAYQTKVKKKMPLVDMEIGMDLENLAKPALKDSRSLRKQLRYNKLFKKQQQSA